MTCREKHFSAGFAKKGVAEKKSPPYIALLAERHTVNQRETGAPLLERGF